jgi:CheY-like chemotaxis protein
VTGNAVKSTIKGGVKIEVFITKHEGDKCDVEIAVEDTGVGMSANELDTLFREFEQVHTDDLQPGLDGNSSLPSVSSQTMLGLGLAVVARSVRNMNGQLRLKSEKGKGTRVAVCIPLSLLEDQEEPLPPPGIDKLLSIDREMTLAQSSKDSVINPRQSTGIHCGTGGRHIRRRSEIDRIVDAISCGVSYDRGDGRPKSTSTITKSSARGQTKVRPRSAGAVVMGRAASPKTFPRPYNPEVSVSDCPAVRSEDLDFVKDLQKFVVQPRVPVKNTAKWQAKELLPSPQPHIKEDKFKVLVAEDDSINSKIMKKRLERMGHECVLTVNGKDCLERFEKASAEYDAVLMDMQVCLFPQFNITFSYVILF